LRFFTVPLKWADLSRRRMPLRYRPKRPAVLGTDELVQLLDAVPRIKYKTTLGTACGAWLRMSAFATFKIAKIHSTCILVRAAVGSLPQV
jgi:hypothetical protein